MSLISCPYRIEIESDIEASLETMRRRLTSEPNVTLTLHVAASTAEDSGHYKVRVVNDCGEVESGCYVLVEFEVPRFTVPLTDQPVSHGKPVQLMCTATGIPRPRITWYVAGKPVTGDAVVTWPSDDVRGTVMTSLTVQSVGAAEAGRSYSCQAANAVGEATTSARLLLKGCTSW